jgi:hypothetical protein
VDADALPTTLLHSVRDSSLPKGCDMTRVLWWALNGAVVVSMVLFLATIAVWVRSYRIADFLPLDRWAPGQYAQLVVSRGGFELLVGRRMILSDCHPYSIYCYSCESPPNPHLAHFRYTRGTWDGNSTGIPFWFLAVTFVSPVVLKMGLRVTRKKPIGLCAKCGYDLRATPGRCPECGTAPKARAS